MSPQRTRLLMAVCGLAAILFLHVLAPIPIVHAAVPQTMAFQGYLTDASGTPVTGTVTIAFALYDVESGGTALWTENHTAVAVSNGLFRVILGSQGSPLALPFDKQYHVGMTVGSDAEMTPRIALSSSPSSLTLYNPVIAPFRYNVFNAYLGESGWAFNNSPDLFGGVPPSTWADSEYRASNMSSDKSVLRYLFNKKIIADKNALVVCDNFYTYSSTDAKFACALFRVRNNTGNDISWPLDFYYTANPSWGNTASIALNGSSIWHATSSTNGVGSHVVATLTIPANRTSTVICVSSTSTRSGVGMSGLVMAFGGNSLQLPEGLEFVDDLDTATGGWEQ